jgi:hypothetical protein
MVQMFMLCDTFHFSKMRWLNVHGRFMMYGRR